MIYCCICATGLSAGSTVIQYTVVCHVCDLRQPIVHTMVQMTAASRDYLYYTVVQYSILSKPVAMLNHRILLIVTAGS